MYQASRSEINECKEYLFSFNANWAQNPWWVQQEIKKKNEKDKRNKTYNIFWFFIQGNKDFLFWDHEDFLIYGHEDFLQCDQHNSMTKEALLMEPIWSLFKIFREQLWGLHAPKVYIYGAILRLFLWADSKYKYHFQSR